MVYDKVEQRNAVKTLAKQLLFERDVLYGKR